MRKILLILLALLAGVLIVSGIVVYVRGESVLRQGIVDQGQAALQAPVELSGVGLNLITGGASLSGFRIGNPEGFTADTAFAAEKMALDLQPFSLFSDVVRIESVEVRAPEIYLEPGRGGTNLQVLQSNLNAWSGPADEEAEATNLIIDRLVISAPTLGFVGGATGLKDRTLTLADIVLEDIGVDEGGVPPAELMRLISDALMPQVQKALASEQGKALLDKALGDVLDTDRPLSDQAKEKAKDALKGLFNRDKQ